MTTLTAPPSTVSHRDEGFLNANISASATSLTVGPIYKWVDGVKTKQGFDSTSGLIEITQGDRYERASYSSASVDATTKITTLSGLTRGLSVTSTTATFTAGTGLDWDKGSKVSVVVDEAYLQSAAYKNAANTFTAAQTITAPLVVSGTTSYVKLPELTTTQRDALTAAEGMMIKNSTTGTIQQYTGGSWSSVGTDATANGSTTVAGKYEEATVAEQAAATATGGTGARLVPAVANLVSSSSGASNGSIPVLNASVALDRTLGGLGTVTGTTAYTLIANGTTATGATQNLASAGTSGQVLTSNGAAALPTFQDHTETTRVVSITRADSATGGASSAAQFNFDTHTYTVPANWFTATSGIEFRISGTETPTNIGDTFTIGVALGATLMASAVLTTVSSSARDFTAIGQLLGTAAAGASVSVGADITANLPANVSGCDNNATAVATNGNLTLQFTGQFSGTGAGQGAVLKMSCIKKISVTAA